MGSDQCRKKERQTKRRLEAQQRGEKPDKNVVTAMANEARLQILVLLNERTASRLEISRELEIPLGKVKYELGRLEKMEPPLVEIEYKKPIRGTFENFYRATAQAYIDPPEWSGVPDTVKAKMRGPLLKTLMDDAVAAVKNDTYDSLPDAHMSWTPVILDSTGWEEMTALLLSTLNDVKRIKAESAERLVCKDTKGVSCTISILGYGADNEDRKVGPSREKDELSDEGAPKKNTKRPAQRERSKRAKGQRKGEDN